MSADAGQDAHKAEFDKQVRDGWIKVYEDLLKNLLLIVLM